MRACGLDHIIIKMRTGGLDHIDIMRTGGLDHIDIMRTHRLDNILI